MAINVEGSQTSPTSSASHSSTQALSPTDRLDRTWWVLRIAFGVIPIVAGLDKFTNLLVNWHDYLNPMVAKIIPAAVFMPIVGVVEIIVGVLVLTKATRWAAVVLAVWLVGIALNLITSGHYFDIAVRDLAMAIGAWSLGELTAAREARVPASERTSPQPYLTPHRA